MANKALPFVLLAIAAAAAAAAAGGGSEAPEGCAVEDLPTPTPFLYFERNGAKWGDRNPVVVLFHGLGSRPQAIAELINTTAPVKLIVPRGFNKLGSRFAWWFERAASSDQQKLADQMKWAAGEIRPLYTQIRRCNPGARIISAGHSQGGMMALNTARFVPEVDRSVAGSAWLPVPLQGSMKRSTAVHGTSDSTVPFARTRDWFESLGSPHKFVEVAGGHEIDGELLAAWREAVDVAIA